MNNSTSVATDSERDSVFSCALPNHMCFSKHDSVQAKMSDASGDWR